MQKGTVAMIDKENRKFGFISPAGGGQDVFFHLNQGPRDGRLPKEGQTLFFRAIPSEKGPKATIWMFDIPKEVARSVWSGDDISPFHKNIVGNLKKFGLEDPEVVAIFRTQDLRTRKAQDVRVGPMLLSALCQDSLSTTDRSGQYKKSATVDIKVFRFNTEIGHIDSKGRFHFFAAPSLREALGWVVATSTGRHKAVNGFDIDGAAKGLMKDVAKKLTQCEFEASVARVFPRIGRNYQHQGVKAVLWAVGVKASLAEAHPVAA
jgi:cold shock CspA family protein